MEDGQACDLLRWIESLAFELGQVKIGIKAGTDLLARSPSLEDYKALKKGSKEVWESIKPSLIGLIQNNKSYYPTEVIKILLYEKQVDEAIKIAEGLENIPEFLVEEACLARPAWSLKQYQKLAANAIYQGAAHYDQAAVWLDRAYVAAKRAQLVTEWTSHIQQLLKEHRRKYNLVPKLKELLSVHEVKS